MEISCLRKDTAGNKHDACDFFFLCVMQESTKEWISFLVSESRKNLHQISFNPLYFPQASKNWWVTVHNQDMNKVLICDSTGREKANFEKPHTTCIFLLKPATILYFVKLKQNIAFPLLVHTWRKVRRITEKLIFFYWKFWHKKKMNCNFSRKIAQLVWKTLITKF